MIRKKQIQFGLWAVLALMIVKTFPIGMEKTLLNLPIDVLDSKFELCDKDKSVAEACAETLNYLEQQLTEDEKKEINRKQSFKFKFLALKDSLKKKANNETEWVAGALNTWLSTIDPHARIVSALEEDSQAKETFLTVNGLGVKLRLFKNKTLVAYAMDGSSAQEAGLKSGDEILSINGISLQELPRFSKEGILRKAKSPYTILVKKEEKKIELKIKEKRLLIENISARLEKMGAALVGKIRVRTFSKDASCAQIANALEKLEANGAEKIELDLRDNPGGFVHEAKCAAGLFLGRGHLFARLKKIKDSDLVPASPLGSLSSKEEVSLFTDQSQISTLPLEILINQNTASAAEMFAAAMQDERRAKLIGSRSFGKGSMQSAFHPWGDSDLLFFKTTHIIDRPSGKRLQYSGVTPDIFTERAEGKNFPREIDLTL